MKRMKRAFWMLMLMVISVCMPVIGAQAKTTNAKSYRLKDVRYAEVVSGEWITKTAGVKFKKEDGSYAKNRWINVDGKIYYMNKKGYRVRGWVKYRGNLYYLNKNGDMRTGWLKKTYYLKENGVRASGICKISGEKYYFDKKTGKMKTGWINVGKNRYFFRKNNGQMLKSAWKKSGKKYCYLGKDGKMKKSCWVTVGDKKYYVDSKGARVTGTYFINGKGYYFKADGVYDPSVKVKAEADPSKPMVALTFDDGPGPYTNRLLNCLQSNNAKATFFMVGSSVPSYKSVVKRMADMGCELGNHSYSHANFATLSVSSMQYQVNTTNQKIREASGKSPTVFRLPYGSGYNNSTVLGTLRLPSIYWSIDTRDWANTGNPQHTVNEVLNNVRNGDIILMHDIHLSTVQAAETIIPALKKRGYQLVTVSQLARYKGKTALHSGTTYFHFR